MELFGDRWGQVVDTINLSSPLKDHWIVGEYVRGCSDVRVTMQGGHKRGLVGPRQHRTPERERALANV